MRHREDFHLLRPAAKSKQGRGVFLFLDRHAIDVKIYAVAAEFFRCRPALLFVVLMEHLSQRNQPSVFHRKNCFCTVIEIVHVASVLVAGFRREVLRSRAGTVEQKPRHSVVNGGFSCGVIAVNAGALSVEIKSSRLNALKISQA